ITFRQLMEGLSSPEKLAMHIDQTLPPDALPAPSAVPAAAPQVSAMPAASGLMQQVIAQQMAIMQQQLAMLAGAGAPAQAAPVAAVPAGPAPVAPAADDEEAQLAHTRYDVKKAFGAIARIHSGTDALTERQRVR